MKSVRIFYFLFVSLFIVSCSDSSDTFDTNVCVGENYAIEVGKQVKILNKTSEINPTRRYEYQYNEYNLLATVNSFSSNSHNKFEFGYGCLNNLNERTRFSLENRAYTYSTDASNSLVTFSGGSSWFANDYQLFYEGQTIRVVGTINGDSDVTLDLETNSDGYITKMTRENSYSSFEYDANGNLIRATDYDVNGAVSKDYTLSYDSNPNPFYGQLNSVYLERFIDSFYRSVHIGIDEIFVYDGYAFPYMKNNPLQILNVTNSQDEVLLNRTYTYDADGYPTEIQENLYSDATYTITYY